MSEFISDLKFVINKHSRENGSGTPDFILAEFLSDVLAVFDGAVTQREEWYGRTAKEPATAPDGDTGGGDGG